MRVLPIENMDGTPYVMSPPTWVRGTREGWRYIDEPSPMGPGFYVRSPEGVSTYADPLEFDPIGG